MNIIKIGISCIIIKVIINAAYKHNFNLFIIKIIGGLILFSPRELSFFEKLFEMESAHSC